MVTLLPVVEKRSGTHFASICDTNPKTDSWGDPNVLFGPYNWNPSQGSEQYCSWDSPTDRPCNYHTYEQGLIYLVHAAGAEIYPSIGGW